MKDSALNSIDDVIDSVSKEDLITVYNSIKEMIEFLDGSILATEEVLDGK